MSSTPSPSPSPSPSSFRFAGCQLTVGGDKAVNIQTARGAIDKAVEMGANVVSLPECFNCPYSTDAFPIYAEDLYSLQIGDPVQASLEESAPTAVFLSQIAKKYEIYLIGGSIPERERNGKIFNTCLIFGKSGELLARHRKMHLFDIDIPGGIRFKESDILSAGSAFTTFQTVFGRFGVGICYDIRFPEYSQILSLEKGCDFLCFPGAFNTTTGPLHWELLIRSRAVDNQVYVAAVSPARNPESKYQAWGHSTIVDPWAKVVATCDENEAIVIADIDLSNVAKVRQAIPVRVQRRHDQYFSPNELSH